MKRKLYLILFALAITCTTLSLAQENCPIIPLPQKISIQEATYTLPNSFVIKTRYSQFKHLAKQEEPVLNNLLGATQRKKKEIHLRFDASIANEEGYQLIISPEKLEISASGTPGCFYGLKSLQQLILHATYNDVNEIPAMRIDDAPRYGWRGFMLDESRHFFGKETVKQLLDMMALQKLNKFHWHLTDEPGWRIEIKKYPQLTTVGGKGNFSNPTAEARYYTQKDIREIIKYAADRHIEVIPEIDMPGHATAANRAYPEFSGGGNANHPDFTFHPGKEGTYAYLTHILREVADLFPSKYIHIGGDEVHFGNDKWAADPDVKSLMQRENLVDIKAVEHYFLKRMSDSIAALNKTVIGWDEVVGAGLSKENTLVMWWRHDKKQLLKEAIESDFEVVLCPRRPMYLDFVQHESHTDGRRWGGFCPLDMIYKFPDSDMTGGEYYLTDKVLGVQANAWTERMHTRERLQFMIFPRLSAVAESGWTQDKNKNYENFILRLNSMQKHYKKEGITVFDVMNPGEQQEIRGPEKKKHH
ncbi:MAG: beta-N-acetylhexosaminidase [Marinilabiliaceae bacterium]|nr:beta-N-acetylhexosaminidase [Marinilabiliaceae bacterium]